MRNKEKLGPGCVGLAVLTDIHVDILKQTNRGLGLKTRREVRAVIQMCESHYRKSRWN